jgi:hypothetical protein
MSTSPQEPSSAEQLAEANAKGDKVGEEKVKAADSRAQDAAPPPPPRDPVALAKQRMIDQDIVSFDPLMSGIKDSFWKLRTQNSTSIDIIAVYLKGQKILYIESKVFCETMLYRIMVPAIAISSITTVLSLAVNTTSYGSILVASLTAFNSFLLAIISYLKLDTKSEAYRVSAYRFDKLQTKCEFFSGKLLFSDKTKKVLAADAAENKQVLDDTMETFLDNLEKDIEDIKEVNQFVIPQHVRRLFPKLYTTNVFAEIKSRGNAQRVYIYDLNAIYNQLAELANQSPQDTATKARIDVLNKQKDMLILNVIRVRDSYLTIDQEFTNEINASIYRATCCDRLLCRRKQNPSDPNAKAQYEQDLIAYIKAKPRPEGATVSHV